MMVNHMSNEEDCGKIILDSDEPIAKKILEFFTHKDSLDILELAEEPISVKDISARSRCPKNTIYRRIPDLVDASMLIAVGREKDQKNHDRLSSWLYEKSFHAVCVRFDSRTNHTHCHCTIIEIISKRKFYGKILKTARRYQGHHDNLSMKTGNFTSIKYTYSKLGNNANQKSFSQHCSNLN